MSTLSSPAAGPSIAAIQKLAKVTGSRELLEDGTVVTIRLITDDASFLEPVYVSIVFTDNFGLFGWTTMKYEEAMEDVGTPTFYPWSTVHSLKVVEVVY